MKKNQKKTVCQKLIFSLSLFLFNFFVNSKQVLAQITNPVTGDLGASDDSVASGGKFIGYVVYLWRAAIILGSLAVVGFFVLGAFSWITAGGEKSKIEDAQKKITNSIIGLVLLVSSFVLLNFLSKLLFAGEFDLLRLTIPGID